MEKRRMIINYMLIIFIGVILFLFSINKKEKEELLIFSGAANKKWLDEVCKIFGEIYGVRANVVYGGSGYVLSQMILSKRGDVYIPGTSDFMNLAVKKDVVYKDKILDIAYLEPAIVVHVSNSSIRNLKDLAYKAKRICIANPENVCLGKYALKIFEKNLNETERKLVISKISVYAESCEKVATLVALNAVDAAIGWSVFQYWDKNIKVIKLREEEFGEYGVIQAAICKYSKNKRAYDFLNFLKTNTVKNILIKNHYIIEGSSE